MENQSNSLRMQKEMASEIESAMPEYFIYVPLASSWLMKDNSEDYIIKWIDPFLKKNQYRLKGVVDIFIDQTIYIWDSEVINYQPQSKFYILVFRRNG